MFTGPCPSNIASTLKAISFDGFENIKVLLRVLGTLPITSCKCERSISALIVQQIRESNVHLMIQV